MTPWIEPVAALRNAGKTYREICNELDISMSYVSQIVRQAKNKGLIDEASLSKSRMALWSVARSKYSVQYGSVSKIVTSLSREQFEWLCGQVESGGYENIAEYLAELVRDAHAEDMADG